MPHGPIVLFDKSALESLNVDESVWFDHFYRANITPLFYVETLADLEKKLDDGRTPEQVVRQLAGKTPTWGLPNVHHQDIAISNLLGQAIPLRGFPVLAEGRSVVSGDDRGIVYSGAPEWEAFHRWQRGEFLQIERAHARAWRDALSRIDLERTYREYRPLVAGSRLVDLAAVKVRAEGDLFATDRGDNPLVLAMNLCGVPGPYRPAVRRNWEGAGKPSLRELAPYAAHVACVNHFFRLAIASDLIGRDRSSNAIDIAYLCYLPFCMIFVSKDRLHRRTAPLFLRPGQSFVFGDEMKRDLSRLDAHFSALPDDIRAQGVFAFASRPPVEAGFLVSGLWDRHLPGWRERPERVDIAPERERELVRKMNELSAAPASSTPVTIDDARFVMIERQVPVQRGKWRLQPPGAENRA